MRIWALMCFARTQREEKSLWPNFLYPWGEDQICRWCGCWNVCPPHKHWKGQWGNCSTSCLRWAATSFTVIAPDSCWKVLFGLNQHVGCAPHGQPSHLGCTHGQHTGACSGQWRSGESNHLCLGMSLLNFECSLGAFKASLSDLAVYKPNSVPLGILCVPGCGMAWDTGLAAAGFLLLWRKGPWWMAQVLFLPCLQTTIVGFVMIPSATERKFHFQVIFSISYCSHCSQHHSAPWGAVKMHIKKAGVFSKGLQFFKSLKLFDLDC